jgi:transcriptional regulator GlxA family with amidase domain
MSLDIAFLVFPGFQILDLSGPLAAFEIANSVSGDSAYRISTVSREGGLIESSAGLTVSTTSVRRSQFDTFIVAGGGGHQPPPRVNDLAATALEYGASARRVASVCTGAFVLADAGLLDGKIATTHWKYSARLQKLHPKVKVDSDCIFTRDGSVWTSAGITAGIDLALALIEDDLGGDAAAEVARQLLVSQHRSGGQSQFSTLLDLDPGSERIRLALEHVRSHLHKELSVETLAKVVGLGPRQFGQAFRRDTGETPAKAIEKMRAEIARVKVETTDEPIEQIAREVGFSDPERMRRAFLRIFGHPPQGLRRAARAG